MEGCGRNANKATLNDDSGIWKWSILMNSWANWWACMMVSWKGRRWQKWSNYPRLWELLFHHTHLIPRAKVEFGGSWTAVFRRHSIMQNPLNSAIWGSFFDFEKSSRQVHDAVRPLKAPKSINCILITSIAHTSRLHVSWGSLLHSVSRQATKCRLKHY